MSGFKPPEEELLSSQELLKRSLDLERVMKERKAAGSSVSLFIDKIRANYQTLIVSDPSYSRAKDAIARLWKQCFYSDIEELRKGMQASAAALQRAQEESAAAASIPLQLQQQLQPRDSQGLAGPAALIVRSPSRLQATVAQEQANLVRLTADFKTSTVKAITFFTNLLVKIERLIEESQQRLSVARTAVDASLPGSHAHAAATAEVAKEVQLLIDLEYLAHRCLIYLGDTARYQEMHSTPTGTPVNSSNITGTRGQGRPATKHNGDKSTGPAHNWHVAQRFYYRALKLVPGSGHAHNQLAVTAVYAEADMAALYHHCCSVLVEEKFATGPANLELFFKKNAKAVMNGDYASLTPMKALSRRYIRLHGILFELGSSNGRADRAEDLLEEFHATLEEVMASLPSLLADSSLSEGTLLKMVSIGLYSIFTAYQSELDMRQVCRSLALIVLLSTISRIAVSASKVAKTPKVVSPFLSGLVAFAMWGKRHQDLLRNRASAQDNNADLASESSQRMLAELLNLENRSRSSMRSSLSTLCGLLFESTSTIKLPKVPGKGSKLADLSISDLRHDLEAATLREFSELVAYAPVAECIVVEMEERACCSLNDLEPSIAFVYRCLLLQDFVAQVLVPTAVVTQPLLTPKSVIDANIEREIAARKAQYKAAILAKKEQAKVLRRQAREAAKEKRLHRKSRRQQSRQSQRRDASDLGLYETRWGPPKVAKESDHMSVDGDEEQENDIAPSASDDDASLSSSIVSDGDSDSASSGTGGDEEAAEWQDEEGADMDGQLSDRNRIDQINDTTSGPPHSSNVRAVTTSDEKLALADIRIDEPKVTGPASMNAAEADDDLDEVIVYKPSFAKPKPGRIDQMLHSKPESAFGGANSSFFGEIQDQPRSGETANGSMHSDIAYSLFGGGFRAMESLSLPSALSGPGAALTEPAPGSGDVVRNPLDEDVALTFSWRERMHAASANQHLRSQKGAGSSTKISRSAPPGFDI